MHPGEWQPPTPRIPASWPPAIQQAMDEAAARERDLAAYLANQDESPEASRAHRSEWGGCG